MHMLSKGVPITHSIFCIRHLLSAWYSWLDISEFIFKTEHVFDLYKIMQIIFLKFFL